MEDFWLNIKLALGQLGTIRIMDIVDILLVAIIFFYVIDLIRRTQSS